MRRSAKQIDLSVKICDHTVCERFIYILFVRFVDIVTLLHFYPSSLTFFFVSSLSPLPQISESMVAVSVACLSSAYTLHH